MTSRVQRIGCLAAIAALAGLGLLLLAIGDPGPLYYPADDRLLILMFGTLFGETSVAALWCSLGPFSLARRLAILSVWLAAMVLAFGFNDPRPGVAPDLDAILTYGVMVLGQWALVVGPTWFVAAWAGLRFVPDSAQNANEESRNRQIGIREAMVLTAAVAAVLGGASLRSAGLRQVSVNWEVVAELGFVTVASGMMTFPPLFGMLLSRSWVLCMSSALLLVFVASAVELAVFGAAWSGPRDLEVLTTIVLMTIVQSAEIIAVVSLLRIGGYELRSRRGAD